MELASSFAGRFLANVTDQLGGTFLAPGSPFSLAALAVSFAIFAGLLARGRRRPLRWRVLRRALWPRRMTATASGRLDLAYFAGGVLLSGLAIGWAIASAATIRAALATILHPAPATHGWPARIAATLALFLAYEFAYWLDHYLSHRVALLWRFHKVHHQAEHLSLLTIGRVHPVDTIVFANITAAMLGVTGALLDLMFGAGVTPLALGGTNVLILLGAVTVAHLQHSHLWVGHGRWRAVLLGPAHHQLHHSADPAHHNCNLGNTLALFDRAFGTLVVPSAARQRLRFGVDDGERAPHGWRAALLQPFLPAAPRSARPSASTLEGAQRSRA